MQDGQLPRLTFEDVLSAQITIRQKIAQFIREKRALNNDEHDEFLKTYFRATLGKGALVGPRMNMPGLQDKTLDDIITNILSISGNKGVWCGWDGTDDREFVSVDVIWRKVLDRLNADVFGEALQQAVVISTEREGGTVFGGLRGKPKE